MRLLETLEELDDVSSVASNVNFSDAAMAGTKKASISNILYFYGRVDLSPALFFLQIQKSGSLKIPDLK